jgi:hypothetical protein
MDLWINTAKEFNDPIPAPKGRRLAFAQAFTEPIASPVPKGLAALGPGELFVSSKKYNGH